MRCIYLTLLMWMPISITAQNCPSGYEAGSITLTTQGEINSFKTDYAVDSIFQLIIDGAGPSNIDDLSPLDCIVHVKELTIRNCSFLDSLGTFSPMVTSKIGVYNNPALIDCSTLDIKDVSNLEFTLNPALTTLPNLSEIKTITSFIINDCDALTSIGSKINITHFYTSLEIMNCANLTSISALPNGGMVQRLDHLEIINNPLLENCLPICELLDDAPSILVENNGGCSTYEELIESCQSTACLEDDKYNDCVYEHIDLFLDSLTSNLIDSIKAINTAISTGTLKSGSDISLFAQNEIILSEGFEASAIDSQAVFSASLEPCPQQLFINDVKTFLTPNNMQTIKVYPAPNIRIYMDKENYFKSDVSAHVIVAMHQEPLGSCRSISIELYDENDSLLDERFINAEFNENIEFVVNISALRDSSLINSNYSLFKLKAIKSSGSFDTIDFKIKNTDNPELYTSNDPISLINIQKDLFPGGITSGYSGGIPFPNGYIKKSELINLSLSNVSEFLITPISYWNKETSVNDPFVKWVKVGFTGSTEGSFTLTKNASPDNATVSVPQKRNF